MLLFSHCEHIFVFFYDLIELLIANKFSLLLVGLECAFAEDFSLREFGFSAFIHFLYPIAEVYKVTSI